MSLPDQLAATGSRIGHYFSVVAMVPAFVAVAWIAVLLASGAWHGPFTPSRAVASLAEIGIAQLSAIVAVAITLGLVINPFQFSATQLLEGYWGGGAIAARLAARRSNAYRRRLRWWDQHCRAARNEFIDRALGPDGTLVTKDLRERQRDAEDVLDGEQGDPILYLYTISQHWRQVERQFPPIPGRVLPTRLGNRLRAFEDRAGRQYGLDAIVVAGHLSLLQENRRTAYVRDARQTMDMSIRLCLTGLLLVPLTAVLLANDGYWVLLASAPYLLAYLAYRGAISAAEAYGNAVTFQIDLGRFALYQALHVPLPPDASAEQDSNASLMRLLRGSERVNVAYQHSVVEPAAANDEPPLGSPANPEA